MSKNQAKNSKDIGKEIKQDIEKRLAIVVLMCFLFVFTFFIVGSDTVAKTKLGLTPRSFSSLTGIFTFHFIHDTASHLFNNLIIFVVLSFFMIIRSIKYYLISMAGIIIGVGILLWMFGRSGIHIGASALTFGMIGLNIGMAIFERKWLSFIIATLVIVIYSSIILTLFKINLAISFESHLIGFIWGVILSWLIIKYMPDKIDDPDES